MTLEQAMREITSRITCVAFHGDKRIQPWSKAPTGEDFITLCSGGFKVEGEPVPCLCETAEIAVQAWRLALLDYSARKPGVLYWREMPVVEEEDQNWTPKSDLIGQFPRFSVYSRLLISDRPVIRSLMVAA